MHLGYINPGFNTLKVCNRGGIHVALGDYEVCHFILFLTLSSKSNDPNLVKF